MDADLRGLVGRLKPRDEAQTDVPTVTDDGDATQHQGSQSKHGHDRPPAIKRERDWAGRKRPADGRCLVRVLGFLVFLPNLPVRIILL
jgi:hypothetical protein